MWSAACRIGCGWSACRLFATLICCGNKPRNSASHRKRWSSGENADLTRLATLPDADIVVVSVAGAVGTEATIAALQAGKDVALATKEVLVAAGEIVTQAARESGARILPIDSEHSAIFQCLQGQKPEHVQKLWLTASGGPFRDMDTRNRWRGRRWPRR